MDCSSESSVSDRGVGLHTARSFRGWRRRRSIGASDTSLARSTRGRPKRRRYHLYSPEPASQRQRRSIEFQAYCSTGTQKKTGCFVGYVRNGAIRRTDSCGFDHVADGKSLYSLVLGGASRAVGAADGLDVAAALLVASAITTTTASAKVFSDK